MFYLELSCEPLPGESSTAHNDEARRRGSPSAANGTCRAGRWLGRIIHEIVGILEDMIDRIGIYIYTYIYV